MNPTTQPLVLKMQSPFSFWDLFVSTLVTTKNIFISLPWYAQLVFGALVLVGLFAPAERRRRRS